MADKPPEIGAKVSADLTPDADGAMSLFHQSGKVIVEFPMAITWLSLEPEAAIAFAKAIVVHAFQLQEIDRRRQAEAAAAPPATEPS